MTMRVLIVDDNQAVRYTLQGILEDAGIETTEAVDGAAALALLGKERFALVISDLRMPRLDGMELLRHTNALPSPPKLILMTAHGSERHAVEAIKAGAFDYFRKPFDNDELLATVKRALGTTALEEENERLASELNLSRSLLFASPAMARLAVLVARVAPRLVTVLITGESGTGKERVAEAIVRASPRAEQPYLRFNCAALTPELAEAELFGHSKGSFTGAHRARPGLFREADGGTLLLDEVGELHPSLQAKLLRVLQEGEVRPVGEERSQRVDVRILAATHRDLQQLVRDGRFREDLYYRFKVVELRVPPLRERPEDITVLARHFLQRFADRFGVPPPVVTPALVARLLAHDWPGNVRELENALESVVALSQDGGTIDLSLLPGGDRATSTAPSSSSLRDRVDAFERELLDEALRQANQNRSEAARTLRISRATLHEKMKKHGLGG